MTHSANQQQISGVWSRAASSYSQVGPPFFQYFGKELVDFARVPARARVLDVATGRGAVLFPAAEKVGQRGEVIGIDYSEGMVEETSAEIRTLKLQNAKVLHMDAEHLEFTDNSFEMVFCSFALFFFPHPDRALDEFRRMLKPGGKLIVSTWGESDARWGWLSAMRRQFASQHQSKAPAAPSLDTRESLERVLTEAGFVDIQVREIEREFLYANAEEWWATQWSHGARIFLEQMPPETLEQGRAFTYEKMAEIAQPEGIPLLMRALFAAATKR
jgi:ubiquinone/menaquinone biosynthesis C-methylase UbiE